MWSTLNPTCHGETDRHGVTNETLRDTKNEREGWALVNTDRMEGAFPIMIQQFRRTIGVAIVRGNTYHKLGRLHCVRRTAEEVANTCMINHSDYRYTSSQKGGSSWYSAHTQKGYATFQQFQNGYDFCIPWRMQYFNTLLLKHKEKTEPNTGT